MSTYQLRSNPASVPLARKLTRVALSERADQVVDTAELLVSELVSNGLRHTDGWLRLRIEANGELVRVSVEDCSPQPPRMSEQAWDVESGRGLLLVDGMSSAWGWDPTGDGKQVWFEL